MDWIRKHRPSPAIAIALAALVVALGGAAFVAIPDSNGTIHACYQKHTGNLRVVTSPSECRSGEHPLAWGSSGAGGSLGAKGFALVRPFGVLDAARSENVIAVAQSSVEADAFCFDLSFEPRNMVVSPENGAFQSGGSIEPERVAPLCPAGLRDAVAFTQSSEGDGSLYVLFH